MKSGHLLKRYHIPKGCGIFFIAMKGSDWLAAKKNPLVDKAYELYKSGMKLVDIAGQLNCSAATIRTWKNRYKWDENGCETFQKKNETQRNVSKEKKKREASADDGTKGTLQNDDLTSEQQMFCIYYSRTFNAAQSYQKAYGCKYESAMVRGSELLRNVKVRKEIERLKEIKRQQIVTGTEDIVELQMRIAFGDIGNVVEFGREDIETKDGRMVTINSLRAKESSEVDTQLIKSITEGQNGLTVVMKDEQRAIDWLTKFFEMNPDDKHRKEFDKRKLEIEMLKLEMQTKDSTENAPEQDNFLEALNASAQEVWSDE